MSTAPAKGLYKKLPFNRGSGKGVSLPGAGNRQAVAARHNLPGSVILVHGVNDVGVAYEAVEKGLCEGLTARLCGDLKPATYRMPKPADREVLEDDPDDVFYKRKVGSDTHSPVIPFYWGYREQSDQVQDWRKTAHGQAVDRYGNRLDRDYSKGGGPFANATTSLADMWNRGKSDAGGTLDWAARDATHPILDNPGRLYMILAARRLAALISMIRDYDQHETVSIVAHSQGCLISLLAQAFLLDPAMQAEQPGARPADTLVLCNPPYSLVDDMPSAAALVDGHSGADAHMTQGQDRYRFINGNQTMHARLGTLANIVKGVHSARHATPPLAELTDTSRHMGTVGPAWKVEADRDNRGKVYLYFSPEDMTVAFAGVEGIGWQGVPDFQRGRQFETMKPLSRHRGARTRGGQFESLPSVTVAAPTVRRPLAELGEGFFQRVFTRKLRPDTRRGRAVLVGQAPHDFVLRAPDEDDHAHTAASDSYASNHALRQHLDNQANAPDDVPADERARFGVRRITGEALPKPVQASMGEGAFPDAQGRFGASENVDQIDAAISVTSDYGIASGMWECIPDTCGIAMGLGGYNPVASPRPALHKHKVAYTRDKGTLLTKQLNAGKKADDCCEVESVYVCLGMGFDRPVSPPMLLIERTETAREARLRWQKTNMPRSFHSAVFGGSANHRWVTAYDVAIGGGKAPTHPLFYKYLCAVADWRLKEPRRLDPPRPNTRTWAQFKEDHAVYWADERPWRKALIEGNKDYYSSGQLPPGLPLPPEGLPPCLVVESMSSAIAKIERTAS